MGVSFWNLVETIGAFILATGILIFVINAVRTNLRPRNAPLDPWDARTLEWMTNNPPKDYNYDAIPSVHSIDEFYHRKYEEDEESGDFIKIASADEIMADQEAHREAHMHMPSPSYWPMVIAFGLPVVAIGLIFAHVVSVIGALIIVIGAYGWVQEPSVADVDDYDPPSDSTKELATVE
jgi:cytochrome c oxidase subunit 1